MGSESERLVSLASALKVVRTQRLCGDGVAGVPCVLVADDKEHAPGRERGDADPAKHPRNDRRACRGRRNLCWRHDFGTFLLFRYRDAGGQHEFPRRVGGDAHAGRRDHRPISARGDEVDAGPDRQWSLQGGRPFFDVIDENGRVGRGDDGERSEEVFHRRRFPLKRFSLPFWEIFLLQYRTDRGERLLEAPEVSEANRAIHRRAPRRFQLQRPLKLNACSLVLAILGESKSARESRLGRIFVAATGVRWGGVGSGRGERCDKHGGHKGNGEEGARRAQAFSVPRIADGREAQNMPRCGDFRGRTVGLLR